MWKITKRENKLVSKSEGKKSVDTGVTNYFVNRYQRWGIKIRHTTEYFIWFRQAWFPNTLFLYRSCHKQEFGIKYTFASLDFFSGWIEPLSVRNETSFRTGWRSVWEKWGLVSHWPRVALVRNTSSHVIVLNARVIINLSKINNRYQPNTIVTKTTYKHDEWTRDSVFKYAFWWELNNTSLILVYFG